MDDKLATALIAAAVSLCVSALAFVTAWLGLRAKRRELERQLSGKYMEKLYELRLQQYPEAFRITKGLNIPPKGWQSFARDDILDKRNALIDWINGTAGLVASSSVMRAVRTLISTLGAPYGNGDAYQKAQMEKMIALTIALRRELRRDIQFLHVADESRRRRDASGDLVPDPADA
jgi:hypothetical protein